MENVIKNKDENIEEKYLEELKKKANRKNSFSKVLMLYLESGIKILKYEQDRIVTCCQAANSTIVSDLNMKNCSASCFAVKDKISKKIENPGWYKLIPAFIFLLKTNEYFERVVTDCEIKKNTGLINIREDVSYLYYLELFEHHLQRMLERKKPKMMTAYVDGSYKPEHCNYSYSFVLFDDEGAIVGEEYGLGQNKKYLKYQQMPGELTSVMRCIAYAKKMNVTVDIHYDCATISQYLDADKIDECRCECAKIYHDFMMENRDWYTLTKVKSHSEDVRNAYADYLASKAFDSTKKFKYEVEVLNDGRKIIKIPQQGKNVINVPEIKEKYKAFAGATFDVETGEYGWSFTVVSKRNGSVLHSEKGKGTHQEMRKYMGLAGKIEGVERAVQYSIVKKIDMDVYCDRTSFAAFSGVKAKNPSVLERDYGKHILRMFKEGSSRDIQNINFVNETENDMEHILTAAKLAKTVFKKVAPN